MKRTGQVLLTRPSKAGLEPDLDPTLFRKEAIEQHLVGEGTGAIVKMSPPWTWVGLGGAALLLLSGLVASFVVETELTSRARAILRPAGGIRTLTSQVSGTVAEVFAQSGQMLTEQAPVVRLDSAQLRAQLLEAERHLQLLETQYSVFTKGQSGGFDEEEQLLKARLATLSEQFESQAQSVRAAQRKLAINLELQRSGLISELAVEDSREAVAQAQRQLNGVRLQTEQARQELSVLGSRRRALTWESEKELRSARSRRDALAYSLDQTTIRAPQEGRIEAILVKRGDGIEPGQVVGKLIPEDAELLVTAFLPERDRAFLRVGDTVRLELDQLPYLEFGTLEGRIARIAGELASVLEVRASAGDDIRLDGPVYPIEVELLQPSVARLGLPLRSGMLGNLRYTLRRQKLITLILAPLRRWLG